MEKSVLLLLVSGCFLVGSVFALVAVESHPPVAPLQAAASRPMGDGPGRFVSAENGDDSNPGSKAAPWRTINHALTELSPGETLYLRSGIYFERVVCAVAGRPEAPVTIRSWPGELAIIDAGLAEFQQQPAECWEAAPDGVDGEFRSRRPYKNIRDVVGAFADSMIGLQTYWYREDLQSDSDEWNNVKGGGFNPAPVYCGPGLWYDKGTGHIHVRLAHTEIDNPDVNNYRGLTDPRRLPLVVAPFGARALYLDQALHLRFQDLVLRGGGHDTVEMNSCVDIEFDNVTIYAGTYGLRARGTGPFKFVHSAIHGNIAPWAFRTENSLNNCSVKHQSPFGGTPTNAVRNVARLNTHAVLVTEGSYEFEVFFYPFNHDWEIAYSDFTDGHDGIYLSGRNIRFHHNHVYRFQDDAIYLSAPALGFIDEIHVYQNLIRKVGMVFGRHSRGCSGGRVFVYRNICDQREGVNWMRPNSGNPQGQVSSNLPLVTHGRGFRGTESLYFYHNLFISPNRGQYIAYGYLTGGTSADTSRWVLNNIMVYLPIASANWPARGLGLAGEKSGADHDIIFDGNIHWSPGYPVPDDFIAKINSFTPSEASQHYPFAHESHGQAADPAFSAFAAEPDARNDYRLQESSPARKAGVNLSTLTQHKSLHPQYDTLPDVPEYTIASDQRPDVGAVPFGVEELRVGRHAAVDALSSIP